MHLSVAKESSSRCIDASDWYDFNEYIAKVQLEDAPLAGELQTHVYI